MTDVSEPLCEDRPFKGCVVVTRRFLKDLATRLISRPGKHAGSGNGDQNESHNPHDDRHPNDCQSDELGFRKVESLSSMPSRCLLQQHQPEKKHESDGGCPAQITRPPEHAVKTHGLHECHADPTTEADKIPSRPSHATGYTPGSRKRSARLNRRCHFLRMPRSSSLAMIWLTHSSTLRVSVDSVRSGEAGASYGAAMSENAAMLLP